MLCEIDTQIIEHSQRFQPLGHNVYSKSLSPRLKPWAMFQIFYGYSNRTLL